MKHDIYKKLIGHIAHREYVDAQAVFSSILEQKVALALEEEKQLLVEPEDDEDETKKEDCGKPHVKEEDEKGPEKRKCKSCGKSFTPQYGEYARCKDCFDKQTDAGERATAGRY
jgi:hypothetical protein